MKTNTYKYSSLLIIAFTLLLAQYTATAQTTVSPILIKQSAKVNNNPKVEVVLYDVPTEILQSSGNEVKAELEYYAQGKEEDLKKLKQVIEENLLTVYQGDNAVKIVLNLHHYFDLEIMGMKWNRVKIKSSNKKETIKLKEFKVKSYKIWLPSDMQLNLNCKYSELAIKTNINGSTHLNIYDSQVTCQNIAGDLSGDIKYSTVNAHSLGNIDLGLYETKLKAEEGLMANLDAKYSEVSIRNLQQITYNGYEGAIYLSHVPQAKLNSKYANISIVSANTINVTAYEGNYKLGQVDNITISGKYIEINGEEAKEINLNSGYEAEVKFEKVGSLISTNGKYNEFKIGAITKKLSIDGYEEEVDVNQISGDFEKITLSGKYLESDLYISHPQPYTLLGTVQYLDLDVDEKNYTIRKKFGDSSKMEFEYEYGNVSESTSEISINGYECDINLQHISN